MFNSGISFIVNLSVESVSFDDDDLVEYGRIKPDKLIKNWNSFLFFFKYFKSFE